MDRDSFLQNHWQAYPNAKQFPSSYVAGRLWALDEVRLEIQGPTKPVSITRDQVCELVDSALGPSTPWSCLRRGDWVLWSPQTQALFLLAPCLDETPPKWDSSAVRWAEFLKKVEDFFTVKGFDHIRTPFLVESPGVDHHIDFMQVNASRTGRQWTLPTSPEIHLKKHLCQGYRQIFEIKNCFRDDLNGDWHRPEFTMLEWYRAFATLEDLVEDLSLLISDLVGAELTLQRVTLQQLFQQKTGFVLQPSTTQNELTLWAQELKVDFSADDDWNDLFFRIFMEKVEPNLGEVAPLVVEGFPPQQASLAQINENGWAERFELYWKGVELANAYLEVNDPRENRQRFAQESALRQRANAQSAPLDESFFAAMRSGMPPASGIALGLDRLYAVLNQANHLRP